MRISITIPTVLLLLLAAYLAVLLPLLPEAAEDIRMADVFSVDEAGAAVVVRHLARRGSFELETFSYGGLFYYIPLGIVYLLDMIGVAPSDRVILVTMRAVCAAAGLGCLVMTWRIGTRVFGRPAAAFGAALLAVTPTFWRWAVEIHPDLPQLFWILCLASVTSLVSWAMPTSTRFVRWLCSYWAGKFCIA